MARNNSPPPGTGHLLVCFGRIRKRIEIRTPVLAILRDGSTNPYLSPRRRQPCHGHKCNLHGRFESAICFVWCFQILHSVRMRVIFIGLSTDPMACRIHNLCHPSLVNLLRGQSRLRFVRENDESAHFWKLRGRRKTLFGVRVDTHGALTTPDV